MATIPGPALLLALSAAVVGAVASGTAAPPPDGAGDSRHAVASPNVLLIVCDDLNDYVKPLGGHPQARTPNIDRLARSGFSFTQAHCNIPICNPSRASFLSGLYPHTSGCYGFENWDENEVLANSRTIMAHFRAHGYHTLGTGKVMHNRDRSEWVEYGNPADYGPFANDGGGENVAHPDVPAPYRDDFGAIDGSFGPLFKLAGRISPATGKPFTWRTGNWNKQRELHYESEHDRDPTADELNAGWAVRRLRDFALHPPDRPFFMGLGFIRPHTPLIVPRKYFDLFPLESIRLPETRAGDEDDTFKHTVTSREDDRSGDRGTRMHDSLVASYDGDRELALRHFIQAYLASVASVDDLIGTVIDTLDDSPLRDDTIVVLTSDHGWVMGEKAYLYKNALWQESTRVPLVIRAPGVSRPGQTSEVPVSLIDLYPTLIDLCGLPSDTVKNARGRPLDGHSLRPLLDGSDGEGWGGPDAVLTALYKWAPRYDPSSQNYSLRSRDWRYIRYENGREELYHTSVDPHEWTNLALDPRHAARLEEFRARLSRRIPAPGASPGPEPRNGDAEAWKDEYFRRHPDADTDGDGELSWPEYKPHKAALDASNARNPKK